MLNGLSRACGYTASIAIGVFISSVSFASYDTVSTIEVELPNSGRQYVPLKVAGRYGESETKKFELYSPYIEVPIPGGNVLTYRFAATESVKTAICSIANQGRIPNGKAIDPKPVTVLHKAAPVKAVARGPNGFVLQDDITELAGNIPCLQAPTSYSQLDKTITQLEITRKSDGKRLVGDLRAVAITNNPAGHPLQMYTPQVFIGGIAYDIYAGRPGEMALALCSAAHLATRGIGLAGQLSDSTLPAVVYKDDKFYLYDNVKYLTLASFLTCGGNSGGDGSR